MHRLFRKCLVPVTVVALSACGARPPKTFDLTAAPAARTPARQHRPTSAQIARFRQAYRHAQLERFLTALYTWSHVPVDWFAVATCETGGDWHVTGSTYSTGLGMMNAAITENSPPDIARAELNGTSTVWDIIATAKRIDARFGIHAWGCGRKLYL